MPQPSQLISDDYRELNASMHKDRSDWGTTGHKWGNHVAQMAKSLNVSSVLDYGCGKGSLAKALPFPIRQYDPAIPEHSALPEPAELVVCLDVLEHIEPERIGAVLDHLRELTAKCIFLVINTYPALNILPDGRNAHVLLRSPHWWMKELWDRFDIANWQIAPPDIIVMAQPLRPERKA